MERRKIYTKALALFLSFTLLSSTAFAIDVEDINDDILSERAESVSQEKDYFSDVDSSTPYYEDIYKLVEEGIISGDGSGMFRPNDYITVPEALTMTERKFGNPESLPSDWSGWKNSGAGYSSTWFNGSTIMGRYTETETTYSLAAQMMLSVKNAFRLPRALYEVPDNFVDAHQDYEAFISLLIYGYEPTIESHENIRERITRAEFSNMLVWAENLIREVPDTEYESPYRVVVRSDSDELTKKLLTYQIYESLMSVPRSILEDFNSQGFSIVYMSPERFNRDAVSKGLGRNCVGYYSTDGKVVVKQTDSRTLLHEFAHFVHPRVGKTLHDKVNRIFEKGDEVKAIAGILKYDYANTNTKEFFAEAYVCYSFYPAKMQEEAPQMYEIMKSIFVEDN